MRLEYEGLARFFRAWFYFEKVKYYGDVPWVDRPIDASDPLLFEKGRDPRELVMQKVVEDLDFAAANLPAEKSVYRVTRWTALALKSRACLFEGTFRKYHGLEGWESYLTASATASKRFIDESGYSVYTTGTTPYLNLFLVAQGARHGNRPRPGVQYLHRSETRRERLSHQHHDGTPRPAEEHCQYVSDERRHALHLAARLGDDAAFGGEQKPGRPLRTDARTPGYKRIDDTALSAPNLAATMTGYQLVKYLQSAKYDSYNASTNDLPLFRAAEVMLNYAEAKGRTGNSHAGRHRPCDRRCATARASRTSLTQANDNPDPYLASPQTGYANVTGDNKGVILEIRRERTVELLMENLRYWDIMRWKEGKRFEKPFTGLYFPGTGSYDLNGDGVDDVCIWSGSKPATSAATVYELNKEIFLSGGDSGYIVIHTDYTRSWNEERDYLYPVPTDDRVLTQGAITQNPGWKDGLNF